MRFEGLSLISTFLGAIMGGTLASLVTMRRKITNGSIIRKRELYQKIASLFIGCKNWDEFTESEKNNESQQSSESQQEQETKPNELQAQIYLYASNRVIYYINELKKKDNACSFYHNRNLLLEAMRKELKVK